MSFQSVSLKIAIFLFVLTLLVVGYLLYTSKPTGVVTTPTNCPNLWQDPNGDGTKCVNSHLLGTCLNTPPIFTPSAPIWETQTGDTVAIARFQSGKLEIVNASGSVIYPTEITTNPPITEGGIELVITETLCILNASKKAVWCASLTSPILGGVKNPAFIRKKNSLLDGETLNVGDALNSEDGKYQLKMREDGNLVLTGWEADLTPTNNNWINLQGKTDCEKYQWATGCDLTWDLITTNPNLC
jgi:hypothetical protein